MEKLLSVKVIDGLENEIFVATEDVAIKSYVVVESSSSLFIGQVVSTVNKFFGEKPMMVVRVANQEDLDKQAKLDLRKKEAINVAKEKAEKLKLDMKILNAFFSFDGNKVVFIFSSENRVDFRVYVKDLANYFKIKIELKQVGARDEAKIIGGIGPCGKVCCCKQLKTIPNVSIKMAKNQNLSLNPNKINGVCGRLMCCLAFENDVYIDAIKNMPKINSLVKTAEGEGYVVYNDLLKNKCNVKIIDDKTKLPIIKTFDAKDIKVLSEGKSENGNESD